MAPHCGAGWVALFSSTELQTQTLLAVTEHAGAGAGAGHGSKPGVGGLASHCLIWVISRLDAFITDVTAVSTVPALGRPVPQVAHASRAAVIAPCCAAWVIVE